MKNHIISISKKIKLPGFAQLSLYDVTIFFLKGLMEGSITTRASSLAFNFFLALFPSIIVIFTLIPYIPIVDFHSTLMDLLSLILPESTSNATFTTIDDIINNPRGSLLSIGFVLALFFSTNGVNSLIEAFNASYHIKETRSLVNQRIIALFITIILSLILITTIGLIIFGKTIVNYLIYFEIITNNAALFILYGKWITIMIMLFLGITILFNIGPSEKRKWQLFTPGSILSTILIILTSIGFNYYINNFSDYNALYGSIGTLIIILLWMYFNSIILLTGFELNVSILNAEKKIKLNDK